MMLSSRLSCRRSFTRWQGTSSHPPDGIERGRAIRPDPTEGNVEEMTEYLSSSNDGGTKPTYPQADFLATRRWVVSMRDDFKVVFAS